MNTTVNLINIVILSFKYMVNNRFTVDLFTMPTDLPGVTFRPEMYT